MFVPKVARQRASVVFLAGCRDVTLVPPTIPTITNWALSVLRKERREEENKMAYYHGHMQTLQKDYPPFNYDDEVRTASTPERPPWHPA